jgi:hypothetical protein
MSDTPQVLLTHYLKALRSYPVSVDSVGLPINFLFAESLS